MIESAPSGLRLFHTTPFVPLPPDSGGKLVPFHHLTGLARRGHEITFLAPIRRPGDREALTSLPESIHVIPVPCRNRSRAGLAVRFAATGGSLRVARHFLPEIREAAKDLLARERFDVAILDSLFTAYLMDVLRDRAPRLPVLLVDHNAESVLFERYLDCRSASVRFAGRLELARIRKAETDAVKGADTTIALSDEDRTHLLRLVPDATIATLPPGADVYPGEIIPPPGNGRVVLFLGDYAWEPNRDAALWLARDIFPRIRREIPDAVLHLAGRDPAGWLGTFTGDLDGVRALGRVEDAGRTIRDAAVFVVPLRIGGGVRLKILEAFANERPVVTTTLGGEGIPLVDGANALVADSAEAIAAGTIALLRDAERAQRIGREGRLLAEAAFGWNAIVDRLDAIVRELAGRYLEA